MWAGHGPNVNGHELHLGLNSSLWAWARNIFVGVDANCGLIANCGLGRNLCRC